eukprot:7238786-Pyramimonas_sp.AAC.1
MIEGSSAGCLSAGIGVPGPNSTVEAPDWQRVRDAVEDKGSGPDEAIHKTAGASGSCTRSGKVGSASRGGR